MSTPEIPNENQPDEGVFVHDLYMDCLEDEMRSAWEEAMDDLDLAIGHATSVAAETWPNSLHTFNKSEGELLILSTYLDVGNVGRCLNFIVNEVSHIEAFGERQVEIYDFIVPLQFRSAAYKRTIARRKPVGHSWDIQDFTGPVVIKRFDSVTQDYGDDYAIPTVKEIDASKESMIDVIDETIAAEQLGAWLCLISDVSYEPQISRAI